MSGEACGAEASAAPRGLQPAGRPGLPGAGGMGPLDDLSLDLLGRRELERDGRKRTSIYVQLSGCVQALTAGMCSGDS